MYEQCIISVSVSSLEVYLDVELDVTLETVLEPVVTEDDPTFSCTRADALVFGKKTSK